MGSNVANIKVLAKSIVIAGIVVLALAIIFIIFPWLFGAVSAFVYTTLTSTVTHSLLSGVSVSLGIFVLIVNIAYCLHQAGKPFSRLEISVAAISNIVLGFLLYPGVYIYLSSEFTVDWWDEIVFGFIYSGNCLILFYLWVHRITTSSSKK